MLWDQHRERWAVGDVTVRRITYCKFRELTAGMTDEDTLGFTYEVLDRYIRTGEIDDPDTKERIDRLHRINLFKLQLMPAFKPEL